MLLSICFLNPIVVYLFDHSEKLGQLDVQTSHRHKDNAQDYRKLRKALCTGYGNQLAERMIHHNGYRTLGYKSQVAQVGTSPIINRLVAIA